MLLSLLMVGKTNQADIAGVPHRLLNDSLQVRARGQLCAGKALLVGNLADLGGNLLGDFTKLTDTGEEDSALELLLRGHVGNSNSSLHEHLSGDTRRTRNSDTETETREGHGVVDLVDLARLSLVLDILEGGSTGKDGTSVSPLEGLLSSALGLVGGVGEGENNGLLNTVSHGADSTLGEDTGSSRKTQHDGRLDGLDNLLECHAILHVFLEVAELALIQVGAIAQTNRCRGGSISGSELGVSNKSVLVQHPDSAVSLLAGLDLALFDHAVNDTLADTNTRTASSDANDALLVQVVDRLSTGLQGSENTSQSDGRGRLDIIVKAAYLVLVLVKKVVGVGVFEVLELDQGICSRDEKKGSISITTGFELLYQSCEMKD